MEEGRSSSFLRSRDPASFLRSRDPGLVFLPQVHGSRPQPSSLRPRYPGSSLPPSDPGRGPDPSRPTWSLSILPGPTSLGSRSRPHLRGLQRPFLDLILILLRHCVRVREGHCAGGRVESQAVEKPHPTAKLAVAGLWRRAQLQVEGTAS